MSRLNISLSRALFFYTRALGAQFESVSFSNFKGWCHDPLLEKCIPRHSIQKIEAPSLSSAFSPAGQWRAEVAIARTEWLVGRVRDRIILILFNLDGNRIKYKRTRRDRRSIDEEVASRGGNEHRGGARLSSPPGDSVTYNRHSELSRGLVIRSQPHAHRQRSRSQPLRPILPYGYESDTICKINFLLAASARRDRFTRDTRSEIVAELTRAFITTNLENLAAQRRTRIFRQS